MTAGLNLNHSSKSEQTTRVKSHRKEAKITVGITLKPHIIAESRKHRLNISRITEQALTSILDYLAQQNNPESSKFLTVGSFPKETTRAGGSVWYERLIRNQEVAGSNPARSTKRLTSKFLTCKDRCLWG